MPLRGEVLGSDRHHRTYMQLGGRFGQATLMLREPGGRWAHVRGKGAVRQLFESLHPDGKREGELRQGLLSRTNLAAIIGREEADGPDDDMAESAPARGGAAAAKLPPPLYLGQQQPPPALAKAEPSSEPSALAVEQSPGRGARVVGATATPIHSNLSDFALSRDTLTESSRRLLTLAAAITRCQALDGPLHVAAKEVLVQAASAEGMASLQPLPPCNAPQMETACLAVSALCRLPHPRPFLVPPPASSWYDSIECVQVREFEERLQRAGQVWKDAKSLQQTWITCVRAARHPVELALALLVLDANMAAGVRSRAWGQAIRREEADDW